MTDKEMKKLSRQELLEMLLEQTRRADELQQKLEEAEEKLNEKYILLQNAGSIAAAALKLNKVFEAADEAVAQYIESVKVMGADAYMPDIPKVSKENELQRMIKNYSEESKEVPKKQTVHVERPVEPDKLFSPKNNTGTKAREIKHLKNN